MTAQLSEALAKDIISAQELIGRYKAEIAAEESYAREMIDRITTPQDYDDQIGYDHRRAEIMRHFRERTRYLEAECIHLACLIAGTEVNGGPMMFLANLGDPKTDARVEELLGRRP